jgi:hypothetical protein
MDRTNRLGNHPCFWALSVSGLYRYRCLANRTQFEDLVSSRKSDFMRYGSFKQALPNYSNIFLLFRPNKLDQSWEVAH